jgi:hypothetical protein
MTCKSGALTLDGGRSSSMRTNNSSTSKTRKFLMLKEAKMQKEAQLVYGATTVVTIKNGLLSTLTKLIRLQIRD